jgi:archaellum biogenesis ATPase FlaH
MKYKSIYTAAVEEHAYQTSIQDGSIIPSTTGRHYLDSRLLGGTNDTDIVLIAASSGVGKSTEMNQICFNIATLNQNVRVLIFSFEVPGRKLAAKLISRDIHVSLQEMYKKGNAVFDYRHVERFKGVPIDIVEIPINIDHIDNAMTQYQAKYPKCRIHGVFDHSLLVDNLRGDKDHDTVVQLSSFMNRTRTIGSRVYIPISQLNDDLIKGNRLQIPTRQYPEKGDLFGSQSIYQVANNAVFLANPNMLPLPNNYYGVKRLPLTIKLGGVTRECIYAHSVKARDGSPGIDMLLNNLEYSELVELSSTDRQKVSNKYGI